MDATVDCTDSLATHKCPAWSRSQVAEKVEQFEELDSPWSSCSQIAQQIQVPRTTLQHWLERKDDLIRNSGWSPQVVQFLESPSGVDLLHRFLTAAHLVFVQANDAGIRSLCWFLQLSGLDAFVAASYGAQRAVAEEMESLLIRFAQQEDQRLATLMPPREISLCEDETFHPQICLVAVEPVSNFILLEQYEASRDADTWNRCVDEKLASMPVTVCQVTSDQAKALVTHTEIHLGAHHSPDLFHVQYDTVKATSLALAGQSRRAEQELEVAREKTETVRGQLQACIQQCPQSSHGQELQRQLGEAEAEQATAGERLVGCQDRQQRAADARQGLGRDYHPYDLDSGRLLEADEVAERLAGHFETLEQVAVEADLSSHAREKIAKARRVSDAMRATICFFWMMIETRFSLWNLPQPVQPLMREQLIAGYYLALAAEKASTAAERHRLRDLSGEIFARARSPDSIWHWLSPDVQGELEQKARACAEIFQRSSSCVEGRNGQLSLKHHALHHLTSRKLRALTVLHNYLVRRTDGSTAAERFYGTAPRDLFGWLLSHLSQPPLPRAGRCAA